MEATEGGAHPQLDGSGGSSRSRHRHSRLTAAGWVKAASPAPDMQQQALGSWVAAADAMRQGRRHDAVRARRRDGRGGLRGGRRSRRGQGIVGHLLSDQLGPQVPGTSRPNLQPG